MSFRRNPNEGPPNRVMGWALSTWKKHQLAQVLDAINVPYERWRSKVDLYLILNQNNQGDGLTAADRIRILRRPRAEPPPPEPPAVEPSATPHPAAQPPDPIVRDPENSWRVLLQLLANVVRPVQEANIVTTECIGCVSDLTPEITPSRPITATCAHQNNMCLECLAQHIQVQLDNRMWNNISCPTCPSRLSYEDIQEWARPETFQSHEEIADSNSRYDQMALRETMATDPTFRWCPAPGCESGQIHERGEAEPIMTCASCGRRSCFIHQVEWHVEETCAHFEQTKKKAQEEADQMEASLALVEKESKQCPNPDCGWRIIKNGGCNHMTCLKCGHEFCWLCFARYDEILRYGNAAHNPGCRHHTAQLEAAANGRQQARPRRPRRAAA
ncbi:hypothetical protein L228DRAFT_278949 [Xylona heveae TC161]|uniref:RBR-type E3 ubiquitin transferase n=1 Tax=Xylona heveae (strain CBS 132557 / TC161) TaxID=1328760 RepID=A0A165FE50_XYLHT|nr:hypothetical protein L228DRAFT_278949 [Xylona heveae TC161]KZF20873.1 hypothetical protein L228DRAFT_278949 [Xylona heveae TC161]